MNILNLLFKLWVCDQIYTIQQFSLYQHTSVENFVSFRSLGDIVSTKISFICVSL